VALSEAGGSLALRRIWYASRWAYAVVAMVSALIAALAYVRFGYPIPFIADEFAYLFAGETFASLELSFPSPPVPPAFWSPHVLVEPTFASKYPPAQGLFLAVGFWVGHPALGILLSGVIAAIALLWALRGSGAPAVGFAVTLGFALSVLYVSDWTRTYMGGLVAFAGSAMVLGSFLRWRSADPSRATFVISGIGASILLLSRPFEGGIVCLLGGVLYAGPIIRWLRSRPSSIGAGIACFALPLSLGIAFQVMLNHSVTGNPLRMPHSEFHAQYMSKPVLLWQEPVTPLRPDARLTIVESEMWVPERWTSRVLMSVAASWDAAGRVCGDWFPFLVAFGVPFSLRSDWRIPVLLASFPLVHGLSSYLSLHFYYAAVAPIWFLIVAAMLQTMLGWTKRWPGVIVLPGIAVVGMAIRPLTVDAPISAFTYHHDLTQALAKRPPSLAFVSYGADVSPHISIVFNDPALRNHALLANRLDAATNCMVADAFPQREIWNVTLKRRGLSAEITTRESVCESE